MRPEAQREIAETTALGQTTNWNTRKALWASGLVVLTVGTLVGVLTREPRSSAQEQPIAAWKSPSAHSVGHPAPKGATPIEWEPSFEAALKKAETLGKPVMVDFYADWCSTCRRMKIETFPDAAVVAEARDFVNVQVNIEKRSDIARKYAVTSLPTILWLRSNGEVIMGLKGFSAPDTFARLLREARQKFSTEREGEIK